jgi:hypothetical protein
LTEVPATSPQQEWQELQIHHTRPRHHLQLEPKFALAVALTESRRIGLHPVWMTPT